MRLALEVALHAKRLDVIFVELPLGNVAVIALDLLLRLELGAEVGRLALAALSVLARAVFTLVEGAAGTAPDVLAHAAIDFVLGFCALRHRGSSCGAIGFIEERALLCAHSGADRLEPSKARAAGASNDKRALSSRARSCGASPRASSGGCQFGARWRPAPGRRRRRRPCRRTPPRGRQPSRAKAAGSERPCATAPMARGAGRRVAALNNDADDRPTAGWAPVCRRREGEAARNDRAGADADQGEAGDARGKSGLGGDDGESGGGERERSGDDSLIAELQPDEIRVEAKGRLADGEERRAEAGDPGERRRLCAQQQRRPERGRRLGRNRESDDDSEPDQRGGEGEAARRRRRCGRRPFALAAGGGVIGETGRSQVRSRRRARRPMAPRSRR